MRDQITLLDKVVQRRFRWFGHVERMTVDSTAHSAVHAIFKGPGASIPSKAMIHFPISFRFSSLFQKMFSDSVKIFPNFTFSQNSFRFSSAKTSDDFFRCFSTFPPYFGKIIISPLLLQISL